MVGCTTPLLSSTRKVLCVARHRKMHLFDIDVEGGQRFRESDTLSPGDDVTLFDTPWGRMGLCICFDLRFEELCAGHGAARARGCCWRRRPST